MATVRRCDSCGKEQNCDDWPEHWLSIHIFGRTENDDGTDLDACSMACAQNALEVVATINEAGINGMIDRACGADDEPADGS